MVAGFIANPCLPLIGESFTFTVGIAATSFINERLADSNYENALIFLVRELLEAQNESMIITARAEITDLIEQDNIFSIKKALIKLLLKTWERLKIALSVNLG